MTQGDARPRGEHPALTDGHGAQNSAHKKDAPGEDVPDKDGAYDEWLTVARAARRLGIGDRRAYRLAEKIGPADTRTPEGGARVIRLSALERLTVGRKVSDTPAKLSDSAQKVSDSLTEVSDSVTVGRQTEAANRQTPRRDKGDFTSGSASESVRQSVPEVSDSERELSDSPVIPSDSGAETVRHPGESVRQLERDVARLEDENRFMREQLAHAISGWRDEQRRTRELETRMKELPAPAGQHQNGTETAPGDAETEEGDRAAGAGGDRAAKRPGLWARLFGRLE